MEEVRAADELVLAGMAVAGIDAPGVEDWPADSLEEAVAVRADGRSAEEFRNRQGATRGKHVCSEEWRAGPEEVLRAECHWISC